MPYHLATPQLARYVPKWSRACKGQCGNISRHGHLKSLKSIRHTRLVPLSKASIGSPGFPMQATGSGYQHRVRFNQVNLYMAGRLSGCSVAPLFFPDGPVVPAVRLCDHRGAMLLGAMLWSVVCAWQPTGCRSGAILMRPSYWRV